jgi:carboxyl-terminal processing protease
MVKYRKALLISLIISIAFSLGALTQRQDNYFEISKNLDIFGKLYREVNTLYVDGVDPTKMMRTGIDAMLGQLDPYTNFISQSEIEDYKFMSTGQYGGIGASVGKRDGKFIVLEPYQDYPAARTGLLAGDEILKVDNETVAGTSKTIRELRDLLRGQKGTQVKLTIKRVTEEEPIEIRLERDRIKIDNVPYYGLAREDIGYISLTGFTQNAGQEVRTALSKLKAEHQIKGVILDLRGNPGGRLDEAVKVSNVFIPQGELIVETRGKEPNSVRRYKTPLPPVDTEIPVAVLVNSRSASASEIVSGSIQDLDRGVIVGQRSFGKGLVQNIRPLSYNTQLKVTTAKYYTPSGRCIQAIDYAHRKEDGSVGKVPDSLKTAFQTKNGRTVYDGGGVEPDLEVVPEALHTLSLELERRGLIFDFATQFVATHDSILGPREFSIDDATYQDFTRFVKAQNFTYQTQAEEQIKKLQQSLKKEEYQDDVETAVSNLKAQLEKSKDYDLTRHRDEISRLLKEEIVQRYYYKQGVIEAAFDYDEDIQEAVKVLRDEERTKKILSGK